MFDERQLDALRELCNIGSGNAATVLSSFLRQDIRIEVPRVLRSFELRSTLGDASQWVVIEHTVTGSLGGRLAILVRKSDIPAMLQALMGEARSDWYFDETARSAVREISNILTSYFLGVLGRFLGMTLMPGIPELLVAPAESQIEALWQPDGILIETHFHRADGHSLWYLLLSPDPQAMGSALNRLLQR